MACGILVPPPEIEPMLPAGEALSLNYSTAREVSFLYFYYFFNNLFLNCHIIALQNFVGFWQTSVYICPLPAQLLLQFVSQC